MPMFVIRNHRCTIQLKNCPYTVTVLSPYLIKLSLNNSTSTRIT